MITSSFKIETEAILHERRLRRGNASRLAQHILITLADQACHPGNALSAFLDPFDFLNACKRTKACTELLSDARFSRMEDPVSENPDPGLVLVSNGPPVDARQGIAWLRHKWQFAATVSLIRSIALPLHLERLSVDQLEQALVKPSSQQAFVAELLCKLACPTSSEKFLGKDFQAWEEVLRTRVQAIYGDDAGQDPFLAEPWRKMSLQTRVSPPKIRGWKQWSHSCNRFSTEYCLAS